MLDLILLALIIVYITDVSGFPLSVLNPFNYTKYYDSIISEKVIDKILTCSKCQIWWIGLFFIIICGKFTIPYICLVVLLSSLNEVFKSIFTAIKVVLGELINKLIKYGHSTR